MLYAIRRLDTGQLFVSYRGTNSKDIVSTWALPEVGDGFRICIFHDMEQSRLDDLKTLCGIGAIYIPVSIGGSDNAY